MIANTDNLRIDSLKPITLPALLMEQLPLSEKGANTVIKARTCAEKIVKGQDDRLLVIVGPCSIHDVDAALDYANKLNNINEKLNNELCIIMRVYFEKPRTIVGWKGLINDPYLNNSFDINHGLYSARKLLVELANIGMPAGTEFLDSIIPQYISDTISWGAIGARTTESQVHRELASGLSMPIGFKNGTDGNVKIALDAMMSAQHSHHFLSVSKLGVPVIVKTTGNDSTHVILRGSNKGPNYFADDISAVVAKLKESNLPAKLMVDCSHGNSNKDHEKQPVVAKAICEQVVSGSYAVAGVMLESNLIAGKQTPTPGIPLTYGQSITDACMSWDTTAKVLSELAEAVKGRRKHSKKGEDLCQTMSA